MDKTCEMFHNALAKDGRFSFHENIAWLVWKGESKRKVYIAKRGGRIDLIGIELQHSAVKEVSARDAELARLGDLRGIIKTDDLPIETAQELIPLVIQKLSTK